MHTSLVGRALPPRPRPQRRCCWAAGPPPPYSHRPSGLGKEPAQVSRLWQHSPLLQCPLLQWLPGTIGAGGPGSTTTRESGTGHTTPHIASREQARHALPPPSRHSHLALSYRAQSRGQCRVQRWGPTGGWGGWRRPQGLQVLALHRNHLRAPRAGGVPLQQLLVRTEEAVAPEEGQHGPQQSCAPPSDGQGR